MPILKATRSVNWQEKGIKSAALLKAMSSVHPNVMSLKSKSSRKTSKTPQTSSIRLIFDYGPSCYRGLMLHRKLKIAPYAGIMVVFTLMVYCLSEIRREIVQKIILPGFKIIGGSSALNNYLVTDFEYGHTRYMNLVFVSFEWAESLEVSIVYIIFPKFENGRVEHFQKKYPDLRVFYHPIENYNRISVRLEDSIVVECNLSNLCHSKLMAIESQPFFKKIDEAIKRAFAYPNLMSKPFRDPICMMTHNLDIDYDYPWYRTRDEPATSRIGKLYQPDVDKKADQRVSFIGDVTVATCRVSWDRDRQLLWNKFKRKVEESPDFKEMLEIEAPFSEIRRSIPKRESHPA